MVNIKKEINNRLIQACKDGFPYEVCGYLIGIIKYGKDTSGLDDLFEISDFMICENINKENPDIRFEINPIDRLKAQKKAELNKLDVIGVYHSHPNHEAYASATDNDFAVESTAYLIYSIFDKEFNELKGYIKNGNTNKLENTEIIISWVSKKKLY